MFSVGLSHLISIKVGIQNLSSLLLIFSSNAYHEPSGHCRHEVSPRLSRRRHGFDTHRASSEAPLKMRVLVSIFTAGSSHEILTGVLANKRAVVSNELYTIHKTPYLTEKRTLRS